MHSYQLKSLGVPSLLGPTGTLPLPTTKIQAFLWVLAAWPDREVSRSQLADLLWNGLEDDRRNALNTLISRARKSLPVLPLCITRHSLSWDESADLQVDTSTFLKVTRLSADRNQLREALDLVRGPFAEGFVLHGNEGYNEWLEQTRSWWEQRIISALSRLIDLDEKAGDWRNAAAAARRALELDPFQERFHRTLMISSFRLGDRAAAIAQYESCQKLLAEQLGVSPSPVTTSLREAIVLGTLPFRSPVESVQSPREQTDSTGTLSGAVHRPPVPALAPEPPLVGRTQELSTVTAALGLAASNTPLTILLGEAGIGKSRLAVEVTRRLGQERNTTALSTCCYEETRDLTCAPIILLLQQALSQFAADRLGLTEAELADLARLTPHFGVGPYDGRLAPTSGSSFDLHHVQLALTRFLTSIPYTAILVLEDIQWADDNTLALLAHFARLSRYGGVRILITARKGELSPSTERLIRQLTGDGLLTTCELGPLSLQDVRDLVVAITGTEHQSLAEQLHIGANGNPLFVIEALRSLNDTTQSISREDLPIGGKVQRMIIDRVERLPGTAQQLVQCASLFVGQVPFDCLRVVSGLDELPALAALDTLCAARLLAEHPESGQIGFCHDLTRRVVYESMAASRRRVMHRRAHAFLADSNRCDDLDAFHVEQLALHAWRGELWSEGLRWSRAAAKHAFNLHAYPAATAMLEQALQCLTHLPPTQEMRAMGVQVRLELCSLSFFVGPERLHHWAIPALADAEKLGDQHSLAQLRLVLVNVMHHRGQMEESVPLLEQVIAYARRNGDVAVLGQALRAMTHVYVVRTDIDAASASVSEALPYLEQTASFFDQVAARDILVSILAAKGDLRAAEAAARSLIAQCRRQGDHAALAHALAFLCFSCYYQGKWQELVEAAHEAGACAAEAGMPGEEYLAGLLIGPALAYLGDMQSALSAQEHTVELGRRLGTSILSGLAMGSLGETLLAAGQLEQAEAAVRESLKDSRAPDSGYERLRCLRLLGEMKAAAGDRFAAREVLVFTHRQLVAIGAVPEAARCQAALALVSEEPERSDLIAESRKAFGLLNMQWDLTRLNGMQEALPPERD